MKKKLFVTVSFALLVFTGKIMSQGCVAIRQMGGCTAISPSNTYNLSKGDFLVGANYRYFHSWRHFVGTTEQPQRQITGGGHDANGVDHGDAVNIYSHAVDLNLSYGLTNRIQLNLNLPWVHNERSQVMKQTAPEADTFRYSVYAKGIGDIRMSVNYWIFDPAKAHRGNLMIGAGIKLPTGNYAATDNNVPQADGTRKNFVIMDQAIQPGDGGLGFSVEVQGFTELFKGIYGFANGYYLFNPKQSNGTYKSAAKPGLEGYNVYACPDQYLARAGLLTSVLKSKSLTLSLAVRIEGIPAYDAFGGQVAYRRPGYVMAIEPAVSYRTGRSTFSLFVPYNFKKNRIQSAADIADQNLQNSKISNQEHYVHVQGDAAFADYSINIGYSFLITNKSKTAPIRVPGF
jgi:hypothetical protein